MHRNIDSKYFITDFGAEGDGIKVNTAAVQKAIDICAENGGGTVVVPPGTYVCGTVGLKSNIVLYLQAGATLEGSKNIQDYPFYGFFHNEMGETKSLIYALDSTDIRITGEGRILLADMDFMDSSRLHPHEILERDLNDEQRQEAPVKALDRPNQPIFFNGCNNIRVDGIKVCNSPCWCLTFSNCKDVRVHNVTIDNNLRVPNSDGIHICASSDVIISDCVFSCGDDCIAVTGITNWEGVSERILISNCIMRSRSAAIRLGHLASKVKNVVISNIVMHETNRGLALFAGNDGWVSNVTISNIIMDTHIYAGAWWGKGEPMVLCAAESTGWIEDITVSNIRALAENGVLIVGSNKNIRDITLKDWNIKLKTENTANRLLYGGSLDLSPVPKRAAPKGKIPWLYTEEVKGLSLDNVHYSKEKDQDNSFPIDPIINN